MSRNPQSRRRNPKAVEGKTMSLTAYRSNRVFAKTGEPVGRVRRGNRSRIFVVQKHDASRLHYDFRLTVNGVLASLGSTQRAFDEPCGQALGRKAGRPSSPICEIRGCDSAWPNKPRQFSSRFGPGSLPAESVARMLTTIKVVGIGSVTDFPIPDAHDSTQVERGHEPSSHADLAEASVNNEFTIFGCRAIQN